MTEDDHQKLLLEDRRAIVDAIFQLSKWLIATLFLLNGAAALAALSRPGLHPVVASVIALFFINGVMSSILAATGFIAALLSSYLRVMHLLRAWTRPALIGILMAQSIGVLITVYGAASSVTAFVSGVKAWANVSIEEVKAIEARRRAESKALDGGRPRDR